MQLLHIVKAVIVSENRPYMTIYMTFLRLQIGTKTLDDLVYFRIVGLFFNL